MFSTWFNIVYNYTVYYICVIYGKCVREHRVWMWPKRVAHSYRERERETQESFCCSSTIHPFYVCAFSLPHFARDLWLTHCSIGYFFVVARARKRKCFLTSTHTSSISSYDNDADADDNSDIARGALRLVREEFKISNTFLMRPKSIYIYIVEACMCYRDTCVCVCVCVVRFRNC